MKLATIHFVLAFVCLSNVYAQTVPPNIRELLKNLPPDTLQKMMEENRPKGEMTWVAVPPQQAFRPPVNAAAKFYPTEDWFQSGSAIAYELDKCVVEDKEMLYIKNVYVLYIDEEKLDSTFTTNQIARTANIKLKGDVQRYSGECNSGELRKSGSGKGNVDFDFVNIFHMRPRLFQSSGATGTITGPGLNEAMVAVSKMGAPVAGSYAQSENKSSYDPKLLDALRKAGFPVPDVDPNEIMNNAQAMAAANGYNLDLKKPTFYGRLESRRQITVNGNRAPAVTVDFGISSGLEADMLVYKPRALSSVGGAVASGVQNRRKSAFQSYFQNAAYNPVLNRNGGFETRKPAAELGGVLVPDQNQDRVQAFVNLDNDDKDGKFDKDDDEVTGGDDDLVKVVLRAKITKSFAAKAQFEIVSGDKQVKVYTSDDKKQEFDQLGVPISITKNFPVTQNGFRIMTLWVEGTEAHTVQRGTKFKFSYWETADTSGEPAVDETFELTVLGVEKIEWKGRNNSVDGTDDLDKDLNHRNPTDQFTNSIDSKRNGRTFPEVCGGKVESSLKNPNAPEAVRVFPGRRMIGGKVEPRPRDMVRVNIKLSVAPVEPVTVYFRSFDVDDPSASDKLLTEVDDESAAEDNRGIVKANNSKTGRLAREDEEKIAALEFEGIEANLAFQVTMQPGDNFRIVGSSDRDYLFNIENDDSKLNFGSSESVKNFSKQRVVDKYVLNANPNNSTESQIRLDDKYASNVLTVWRFFYTEVDYMGEITENKIKGTVRDFVLDDTRISRTTVKLDVNLTDEYEKIATNVSTFGGTNGVENAFQEGKIRIGGATYDVLYNTAGTGVISSPSDSLVIQGDLPENAKGSTFFLWDDDDAWGFRKGMNLRDVVPVKKSGPDRQSIETGDACYVAERYLPAYIVPDFKTLRSTNKTGTVDFVRNVKGVQVGANDKYFTKEHYKFDNSEYDNAEDFWAVYLLFGYKGATYEDADPDGGSFGNILQKKAEGAIEGFADLDHTGLMVFLEGVVERNGGYQVYNGYTGEEDCIAHEIGHVFGASHDDKGLMGDGGDQTSTVFSDKSLKTIRSAKHP